jgi:hypothetical protein
MDCARRDLDRARSPRIAAVEESAVNRHGSANDYERTTRLGVCLHRSGRGVARDAAWLFKKKEL